MKKDLFFPLRISLCTIGYFYASTSIAQAQVTPDGTVNTQVTENGNTAEITGGQTRGSNLFHSFQDFSVGTGNEAFFNNANDISNIFSRVTGGNISSIDGLIRANGTANLFLINPAGIVFGNNARLDIGGSFLGTTANSVLFDEGVFSATDLDNPPLLTINAPIGLNFRDDPSEIVNRAGFKDLDNGETLEDGGLTVDRGEFITLVGGNVNLENGRLTAPGGRIELGGLAEAGTIQLNPDLSLNFAEDLVRSDVSLTGIAELDVTSGGGGDINIFARNINILGGSDVCGGIGADGACGGRNNNFGSVDAQAGDITFNAIETITIGDRFSDINNDLNSDAFGSAGNINIKAKSLFLNDGGRISAGVYGEGNGGNIIISTESLDIDTSNITSSIFGRGEAGDITVSASQSIEISGDILTEDGELFAPGGILNQVEREGEGQGGELIVETPLLNVSNGGKVQVATFGQGNPGNLSIRASNINVFNTEDSNNRFSTGIFAGILLDPRNEQFATGETTSLTIDTETLSVRGGAQVSAETSGIGNGSNILINATELVEVVGTDNKDGSPSIISAEVGSLDLDTSVDLTEITRNGGNITINTSQLKLRDGGVISTDTFGIGNSGNITINATQDISLDNSSIFSEVNNDAVGDAGTTTIITDRISLSNESVIGSRVFGEGKGGNINLGSEEFSIKELNLTQGSQISVSVFGQGNAGELSIFSNNIEVDGGVDSLLTGLFASVEKNATGKGGNIFVQTDSLTLTDGGRVAANVEIMGQGDAGTLEIFASDSIVINGTTSEGAPSAITSVVNGGFGNGEGVGDGGDITITTGFLSLIDGGRVSTTSLGQGNGGDLTINAFESIFISGFAERFRSGISVNALINDGNSGNANITTNQLIIENGGTIEASNLDSLGVFPSGTGEPGNINIQANSMMLNNGGRIDAATQAETGEGANINLQIADNIILQNNSFISAQAFGNADGGNLTIDTNFIIAFPSNGNGNDILASAQQGQGGNITINAESLFGIRERTPNNSTNDINASSQVNGLDGTINITTPDINPIQGATELPSNIVVVESTTQQACEANRETIAKSGLTISGKGGIPSAPESVLSSDLLSGDNQTNSTSFIPEPIETSQDKIQPARGIKITESGEIILTAYRTDNAGNRLVEIKPNCDRI